VVSASHVCAPSLYGGSCVCVCDAYVCVPRHGRVFVLSAFYAPAFGCASVGGPVLGTACVLLMLSSISISRGGELGGRRWPIGPLSGLSSHSPLALRCAGLYKSIMLVAAPGRRRMRGRDGCSRRPGRGAGGGPHGRHRRPRAPRPPRLLHSRRQADGYALRVTEERKEPTNPSNWVVDWGEKAGHSRNTQASSERCVTPAGHT
jgi:hypothetical protein